MFNIFFLLTDNFRKVNGPEFVRIYVFQMAIGVIEIGLVIITTVIMIPIINKAPTCNQFPINQEHMKLGYPGIELIPIINQGRVSAPPCIKEGPTCNQFPTT